MDELYKINIYERYRDLKNSGIKIEDLDNKNLWKIFEYFTCIKLFEEYKQPFYEYDDIEPSFKEKNKMSRNDTGIDACNLIDTIVQCKLRSKTLGWKECSTFFGSQTIFSEEEQKKIIKWKNLIISRNSECKISTNLEERKELFIEKKFSREEIISYCENLLLNPPKYPEIKNENIKLRDYQIECINLIKNNKNKNVIICIPTGCGKNLIIINSLEEDKKYLILVPRIILMEQLKNEILKYYPAWKNRIQLIGDKNDNFKEEKYITICIYNSFNLIEKHSKTFHKIFIDEAHHINIPELYTIDDEDEDIKKSINESESVDEDYREDDCDSEKEDKKIIIKNEIDIDENLEENENSDKSNKYIENIKNLTLLNNNVYLSATIDKYDNFEYYKKELRDMIKEGYLCDYNIHIPIFDEDPSNKNLCQYLINNYRNIIIYCNSQKEGIQINNLLNLIQKNCSSYIDCLTPKKIRNEIIKKYKNGDTPFLVNVRILVEGFDAPITKGVFFMHLPKHNTTLIQILGRALRLHPLKKIANIILPFSLKEDEKNINNFLKVMARNDRRIKKSYINKKVGGYISIENDYDVKNDDNKKTGIFRYDMIYNSMGELKNKEDIWNDKFNKLKKYLDDNNKKPLTNDLDKDVKRLAIWLTIQKSEYKNHVGIMEISEINNKWKEFIETEKYNKILFNIKKSVKKNYKSYTCKNCNKIFDKKSGYIDHMRRKFPCSNNNLRIKIYKCENCGKIFDRKSSYDSHVLKKKNPCIYKNANNNDNLPINPELSDNCLVNLNKINCEYCDKYFSINDSLQKHSDNCEMKKTFLNNKNSIELLIKNEKIINLIQENNNKLNERIEVLENHIINISNILNNIFKCNK